MGKDPGDARDPVIVDDTVYGGSGYSVRTSAIDSVPAIVLSLPPTPRARDHVFGMSTV